jgi:hypothetical protein
MVASPKAAYKGSPVNDTHKPRPNDIIALWNFVLTSAAAGGRAVNSLAALEALSPTQDGAGGLIWASGDAAVDGIYSWDLGSTTWTRLGALPIAFSALENIGGTANAITADVAAYVAPGELKWAVFTPLYTNTLGGGEVIDLGNGDEPLKNGSGADLAPGDLVAGVTTQIFKDDSGNWRQMVSSRAGATMDFQGAWNSGTTYTQAQFVSHDNKLFYLTAVSSTNEEPGAGGSDPWLVVVDFGGLIPTGTVAGYETKANFEAASISSGTTAAIVFGYNSAGDCVPIFLKKISTPSPVKSWHWQSGDGAYWQFSHPDPEPRQFGAVSGAADGSFTTDSGTAFENWLEFVNTVTHHGEIWPGFYLCSKRWEVESGTSIIGHGTLVRWEIPFFDLASVQAGEGVTVCFTGTGTRDIELDYCSNMRHTGAYRTNSARSYTNANDQYFEATDFSEGDASGATKATLKSVSAAVLIGEDGLSGKTEISNIRFVPKCDDASNGPLAGYLNDQASTYVAWDEWDVGILSLNPYGSVVRDCQVVGYWHMKGVVQSSIRFGNTQSGGRGELCAWERNEIHGGVAIRNGDFFPILSKTASTIVIEWSPGHRFDSSGTVKTDVGDLAYTGLTYTAGSPNTLTFTGISSTASVVTSGDSRSFVLMTNNNGTTQTVFRDNNIRGWWHATEVERPSTAFSSQAGPYTAAIEIVGFPVRGVTFENNTIYCKEPLWLLNLGGRNIFFDKGTGEAKSYKTSLGGGSDPDGAAQCLVICGPQASELSNWPMQMRGDVTLFGFPWQGSFVLTPMQPASSGRRYSSETDAFNPFRYQAIGEPNYDKPVIYDARQAPEYTISGGAITAYHERILVDTESNASTDDLDDINAPYWLNRIILSTANSGRDVTVKNNSNINLYGSDITLYATTQSIELFRTGPTTQWQLVGNYGATGAYANVNTVGGKVVSGS